MIVNETNAEYHGNREAISKSRLANMSVCPAYFKWCEENPQEMSQDLLIGSAFHKLVLEPDTFEDEFMVAPSYDRRTKEGKLAYNHLMERLVGVLHLVTQEQYDTICGMRDSIMMNKYARQLIKGNREQSIYFTDELTGEACKCRPDVWRLVGKDRAVIIDLKSTRSARSESFMKDIVDYHYDLQTYMYRLGVSLETGIPIENIDFVFIPVEKKPPYLINVFQADTFILQRGEQLFRRFIGEYHDCRQTGNWYGLNGKFDTINTITLPHYLLKEIQSNG